MAHALIAVAQWVGAYVAGSALEAGASLAVATWAGNAAIAATLVAEVAAVSAATTALTPKVGGDFGTQVDFKADPRGPIPYAMGRTATGGSVVFQQTAGAKNIYQSFVTVYTAAGPIDSYESFLVNGVAVTFGTDQGEGASGYYQNRMWRVAQLGQTPESSYLHWTNHGTKDTPGDHGGLPSEWTSAHKLSGYAADLWTLQYNTTVYSGGVPSRLTVGKWVKVYDPRKDSTYPGGSGSHRALNESTYEWSENPYLHALTWCLGRFDNGVHTLGFGAPPAMIDMAAFVEGANVADANGWTMGGVVYSTDDKWEVLKALLQAGGGKPMRLGSKISCLVATPRTSLATLTGADVVGEASITGTPSRRTRINTIWPKYREEAQNWEIVTADEPVSVAAHIADDGGKVRSREIEYPMVQNSDQAAMLARYDIENSREFGPVTLPCKPRWMGYKPGDCITVDEPEYGLNGQKMMIVKRSRDPVSMVTTLTLMSETDGKHPFALGQTMSPPGTPGLTGHDPNESTVPATNSWTVVGTSLIAESGARLPALVFIGETEDPNVVAVIAEWRVVLDLGAGQYGDWMSSEHAARITRIEARALLPETQYHCRIRYRTVLQAESDSGLDLGLVTTGQLIADNTRNLGTVSVTQAEDAVAKIEALVAKLTQEADATVEAVEAAGQKIVDRLAQYGLDLEALPGAVIERALDQRESREYQTALSYDEAGVPIKQRLFALEASAGDNFALIFSDYATLAGVDSSIASATTTLTTDYNAAIATATENLITVSDAETAIAASATSLTTTFNGNIASAVSGLASTSDVSSAISSYNTTLQASVSGGLTSTVSASATAISNLEGAAYGAYTIKVSAGNVWSGLQLLSSSGHGDASSQIILSADALIIRKPGVTGADLGFTYDSGSGTLFVDNLTIKRGNIQGAAISTCVGFDATTSVTLTTSNAACGPALDLNSGTGADVFIDTFLYAENTSSSSGQDVTVKVYRDGAFLNQKIFHINPSNQGFINWPFLSANETGYHVYQVQATATPGTGGACTATEVVLRVNALFKTGL